MAQRSITIRLGLQDADVVKRGLQQVGADGEKALARIEAASRQPSAGLKALSAASGELHGRLGGLAGQAGIAGNALSALGKGGLAAAAGLGATVLVVAKVMQAANAATEHFGNMADAAQRAGTTAEYLQVLQRIALENSLSIEELNTVLETLRLNISKAAAGQEEAQKKFQNAGISMDRLKQIGGDTSLVLVELARNGSTAAEQSELLGRAAKGMGGTMQNLKIDLDETVKQLKDLGLIASNEVVSSFDELADKGVRRINEEFAKWSPVLLAVAQGLEQVRTEAFNMLNWLQPAIAAAERFWKVRAAITSGKSWESLDAMRGALRGALGIDENTAAAPSAPQLATPRQLPTITINPPAVTSGGGGGGGKSDAERAADEARRKLEATPGRGAGAVQGATLENEAFALALRVATRDQAEFTTVYNAYLEALQRKAAFDSQAAWGKELESRREALQVAEYELSLMGESATERARLVAGLQEELRIRREMPGATDGQIRALKQLAEQNAEVDTKIKDLEKSEEQWQQVAKQGTADILNAFGDIVMEGKKLEDVFEGLTKTLQRLLWQKLVTEPIGKGIDALFAGGLGGLFGSGTGAGYGTTGTAGANVTAMTSGGTNSGFLLGGAAHGAVFDRGNVIPFARGGIVDRPTLFPMARGTGLMGEAGPEAIMPLERLPSGRLGVQAGAAAAPVVNVQVVNNAGAEVKTEATPNDRGGVDLTVIIDSVEKAMAQRAARPGTTLNRALGAAANPIRAR